MRDFRGINLTNHCIHKAKSHLGVEDVGRFCKLVQSKNMKNVITKESMYHFDEKWLDFAKKNLCREDASLKYLVINEYKCVIVLNDDMRVGITILDNTRMDKSLQVMASYYCDLDLGDIIPENGCKYFRVENHGRYIKLLTDDPKDPRNGEKILLGNLPLSKKIEGYDESRWTSAMGKVYLNNDVNYSLGFYINVMRSCDRFNRRIRFTPMSEGDMREIGSLQTKEDYNYKKEFSDSKRTFTNYNGYKGNNNKYKI